MNYIAVKGTDGKKDWYAVQHIQNIADLAEMICQAVREEACDIYSFERHLGEDGRSMTETEFAAARERFMTYDTDGLLAELDFPNDRCRIFNHVPTSNEICLATGMISRLAGIYELALDRESGLDINEFTAGLASHYSVTTLRSEPRNGISGMKGR